MPQYPINRWMRYGPEKNLLLGRILHPAHDPFKSIQFVSITKLFAKTTLLANSLILNKT
jgi:hypothetical protein